MGQAGVDKREQLAHTEERRAGADHLAKGHNLAVAADAGLAGVAALCTEDGGRLARLRKRPQRGLDGGVVAGGGLPNIAFHGLGNVLGELSDVPGKPGNLVYEIVHVPWLGDHGRNGRAQLIGGGGIDGLENLCARAQEGIRAHALQGGDISLVAIARDGGPNLGVKVDVLGATELRNDLLQAAARHGRRQLTVLGLGVVGVAAAGGNNEVRLLPARLIAQAGARGRILHEFAAALDCGQRHNVIKAHAQTAYQHVLAGGDSRVVLLYRVIRGDPVQTGSGQLLFLLVVFRSHPAIGQYRGIGAHLGAIG